MRVRSTILGMMWVLGLGQCLGVVSAAAKDAPKPPAAVPDDFSGTWKHDPYDGINPGRAKPDDKSFTLTDGTVIPLRPAAEKLYRERVAMSTTDNPFANTTARCLPLGMPGDMMGAPYPQVFLLKPNFVGILNEEGWQFRAIYMTDKHPEEVIPSFMGHSIGHWEGKTLVVDTVGLRDETTLNFTGLPHSTRMHILERITRTAPDTLVDVIEVDDPATYYKPFTLKSVFVKSDEEMIEYICEKPRIQVTSDGRQTYSDPAK